MAWIDPVINKRTGKIAGYKIRYRLNGKKPSSEIFATKAAATGELPRYQAIEDSRKSLDGTRAHAILPLSELIRRYLDYRIAQKRLKPEYYNERLRDLLRTVTAGHWITTSDITLQSVIAWRTYMCGRDRRGGAYLRGLLSWASDIDQPVCPKAYRALKPTKSPVKIIPRPSVADVKCWLEKSLLYGSNVAALVHCCVWHGWRPSMAARMRVEDYDPEAGCVLLRDLKQQGGGERKTFLVDSANVMIRSLVFCRDPKDYIFLDPRTGQGWMAGKDRCAITHWWRRHIDPRTGKGVYNLKYDAMSHMADCGLNPAEIQAFTGHKDLRQVLTYLRTNEERQKASISRLTAGARWGQDTKSAAISPETESHKPLKIHGTQS